MRNISVAILSFIALVSLTVAFFYSQKETITFGIDKEIADYPLEIEGTLPIWLQGTFVRNSAIPIYQEGKQVSHVFDGLAMLHAFDCRKG